MLLVLEAELARGAGFAADLPAAHDGAVVGPSGAADRGVHRGGRALVSRLTPELRGSSQFLHHVAPHRTASCDILLGSGLVGEL